MEENPCWVPVRPRAKLGTTNDYYFVQYPRRSFRQWFSASSLFHPDTVNGCLAIPQQSWIRRQKKDPDTTGWMVVWSVTVYSNERIIHLGSKNDSVTMMIIPYEFPPFSCFKRRHKRCPDIGSWILTTWVVHTVPHCTSARVHPNCWALHWGILTRRYKGLHWRNEQVHSSCWALHSDSRCLQGCWGTSRSRETKLMHWASLERRRREWSSWVER